MIKSLKDIFENIPMFVTDDPQDIPTPPAKKIPKRKSSDVPKCGDIGSFFSRSHHAESRVNKSDEEKDCIVID